MAKQQDWFSANQTYLMAAVERIRAMLLCHCNQEAAAPAGVQAPPAGGDPLGAFALDLLCRFFALSPFERDLLVLCAGVELDANFGALLAEVQGDSGRTQPTFSVALAVLPAAHWSALTPTAALRRWRLIEVIGNSSLLQSTLRIDERVLHYLAGVAGLDEHLLGFVEPVRVTTSLTPSQRRTAGQIATLWGRTKENERLLAVELTGQDQLTKTAIAAAVCSDLGMNLYQLRAQILPTTPHEVDILLRLWEREAALSEAALLLDCEGVERSDGVRQSTLHHFIESLGSPLFVMDRERRPDQKRLMLAFDIQTPTVQEQQALWQEMLGPTAGHLNGQADRLTAQFNLSAPAIQAVCVQAVGQMEGDGAASGPEQLPAMLWQACRTQARPRLDDLAQRIEPVATWEDLVLPERERQMLHDMATHVRHRTRVYETWGFAAKSARGLGISALFAGPSGTGKTMAAEVLANELQLDLYCIDLSQVVSKYIGETEKNLARVFDAADAGGAILLFDEADALFGKRGEVKDSHDRYANIEVSFLLQRMEAYRGLAILTTNMKSALDQAFLRRLRFVVQFPFPAAEQRAAIWARIFPAATPTRALDVGKLAQLNVAGGNIRNIALHAAVGAAAEDKPVCMEHLLRAARNEYNKLEKTLTTTEIKGWM
jgi:hypothetical protein